MTAPSGPAAREDVTPPVVPLPRSGGGHGTAGRNDGSRRLTAAPLAADGTGRGTSGPAVAARLAVVEARRLLRHPVLLAGCALYAVSIALGPDGPRDAFDIATAEPTLFVGVAAYFAGSLAATRTRRSRAGELLGPLPTGEHLRTVALCLACLAPALACTALVLVAHALALRGEAYVVAPAVAHLVQGPLTVLGGALLGIMVARWAPYPGAALLVMVAMVAGSVYLNAHAELAPLGTYVAWATWRPGTVWAGLQAGSPGWHVIWLTLLCAMAVAGALLPTASRSRLVLGCGALLTALAVAAGSAALP